MSEVNQVEEEVSNPYNMNKAWHTPDGPKVDSADGMFFERPNKQATSDEAPVDEEAKLTRPRKNELIIKRDTMI